MTDFSPSYKDKKENHDGKHFSTAAHSTVEMFTSMSYVLKPVGSVRLS